MGTIGIIWAAATLVGTCWYATSDRPHKSRVLFICLLSMFFGAFLILQDRVVEISVNRIGTIKAATKVAVEDAMIISEIRRRIESQSATIDLVAEKAGKIDTKTQQLDQLLLFNNTLIFAQADDRRSFNQLYEWACNESYPYCAQAKLRWGQLKNDVSTKDDYDKFRKLNVEDCAEILNDTRKKSLDGLIQQYKNIPPADAHYLKGFYIIYIADKRRDIALKERLGFLIDVIKTDPSLNAARCAGWMFWANTIQKEDSWLNTDEIIGFWENNKETM